MDLCLIFLLLRFSLGTQRRWRRHPRGRAGPGEAPGTPPAPSRCGGAGPSPAGLSRTCAFASCATAGGRERDGSERRYRETGAAPVPPVPSQCHQSQMGLAYPELPVPTSSIQVVLYWFILPSPPSSTLVYPSQSPSLSFGAPSSILVYPSQKPQYRTGLALPVLPVSPSAPHRVCPSR